MLQVTLTIDILTPKSIGIIYRSFPTKSPITVSLILIGFMLLGGHGFYALGHRDRDL